MRVTWIPRAQVGEVGLDKRTLSPHQGREKERQAQGQIGWRGRQKMTTLSHCPAS